MKSLMRTTSNNDAEMQGLTNNLCEGNIEVLANRINEFLVSVSSNLPRPTDDLAVFDVQDEIPAEYVISVMTTENALQHIKVNKAVGPDNVSAWFLRDNASTLAVPLTALLNTSLRDGVIPALWTTAHVIPLPNKQPPRSIEKDIRPISLTPIVSKMFESIVIQEKAPLLSTSMVVVVFLFCGKINGCGTIPTCLCDFSV